MRNLLCGLILAGSFVTLISLNMRLMKEAQSAAILQAQLRKLELKVDELTREQGTPAMILDRYRNSIGYINGIYRVGFANQVAEMRVQFSGTGFLVGDRLVATNRHVAEPWYKDSRAQDLIHVGAKPVLENLVIFFPDSSRPIKLSQDAVSETSDLAILRLKDSATAGKRAVLPLASSSGATGQYLTVLGYPMGIEGMVAKSPSDADENLVYRYKGIEATRQLAAHSLIRPFATWGHLGDVVGYKLTYDAATARGGSGGPVLNSSGEVIGVNSGYMGEFSGASFGVSVESLRPLLQKTRALP